MTQGQLLTDVGKWAIVATFYVTALFPVVTAVFWRWWESWWGRNIVALELAMAVTLLGAWLRYTFGLSAASSLTMRWVDTLALCTVPVIVSWRGAMIIGQQRSAAHRAALEEYRRRKGKETHDAAGR